ncbi:MAG TPA: permease-like cell division protein FtsX [Nitrospirales bacterium]|nr:permease-like cell division protein FtsX [Nitrospirales bacterium]
MTRLRYLLGEAVDNIRANRTTTLIALVTVTFTMLGMGVFLLLYLNVQGALGSLREEIKVLVYLRDTASPQAIADLRARVSRDPAVAAVEFVSREQALAAFRAQFPSEDRLLKGLGENPFPASFVIRVSPGHRSSGSVEALVQKLKALPDVEEVQYSRDWIENLAAALRYLEILGWGVGAVLAASMVTILANTIRLTLYARREEIEILKLIGATAGFIKTPFVLEGALLGGMGAACSLLLLRGAFEAAEAKIALKGTFWGLGSQLAFLPGRVAVLFLILGIALGCLGSWVSLMQLRDMRS